MGILNRCFGSAEVVAKDAKEAEHDSIESWKLYLQTVGEKEEIISRLPSLYGQRREPLQKLVKLLKLELVDIDRIEKQEAELVADIEKLEHDQKIRRVEQLENCLGHYATRHQYVYELMRHLYAALKEQKVIVKKLLQCKDLRAYRKLVHHLQSEWMVEQKVVGQVRDLKTFHTMLTDVVRGEHIIRRMNQKEKRLVRLLEKRMQQITSEKLKKGVTYHWVKIVFDEIEERIHELVADDVIEPHHAADLEFVNREEFVALVKNAIHHLRERDVSMEMLQAFVHIFREWYNYEYKA